ncbi:site-specific integrase [Pseudonocardia ailaonensis]|uniref:site-specific integrase n=1 Tax=Pseudonocardia ailaonensis TaxID=367279 RepID=UPI0031DEF5B7
MAAEEWIETVNHAVAQGLRSPNTAQLYRLNMNVHVLPAVGELRLREITVPRLDRVIQTLQLHKGSATAKIARTVISGSLGLAVRHGAISSNPVRDIGRIASAPRRAPRALTPNERVEWISRLRADEDAVRKDLPDLCEWMLGTGVRIGEALAVSWDEVDLAGGLVEIEHTIVRITGVGLLRKGTKSTAGERTLRLPAFAVAMLRRRKLASGGRGPVFPDSAGGWRDPSNTSRDLRNARGSEEFAWVTSHVFRKTAATELDRAGLTARQIADQLGHAKVSMTQDRYLGRRALDQAAADALDRAHKSATTDQERKVSGP